MAYSLEVEPDFWKDFQAAMDYYSLKSFQASEKLYDELLEAFDTIISIPFFEIKYKNYRACKLPSFPYSIYYTVSERNKLVICFAFVNLHQDSNKYPT